MNVSLFVLYRMSTVYV